MERFQPAAQHFAMWMTGAHPHPSTAASSVWQPQFPQPPDDATDDINATAVVELPLFTLGPKWSEFYGYIGVGSPSQTIRVLFDTMSSDLTMLGYDRSHHEMYNHNQSSSYVVNNTVVLSALPGSQEKALGLLSQDRVALSPQLRVPKQIFTEVVQTSDSDTYFDDTRADGWFGLARSINQQAFATPSLMDRLINQSLIREPVVGIHLNPKSTGLITFGGVNSERFDGNLSYVDVAPLISRSGASNADADRYWSFHLNYILVNGQPVYVPPTGSIAVLDAVRPTIQGPREAVDAIHAALGLDNNRRVPCHDPPDEPELKLLVVLDGMALELGRPDLVMPAANGPGCVSLLTVAPSDASPLVDWYIGAPLMQSFYTALDFGDRGRRPRIGFARSKSYTPPSFSAYDSLWLVLLGIVLVLIVRSIGRAKHHGPPRYEQLPQ